VPRYGEWNDGLDHIAVTRRTNGTLYWEDMPWSSSPSDFPFRHGAYRPRSLADVHGIGFPEWDTGDYLEAHGYVSAASSCAYAHARAPHLHQQLWWPEGGSPATCTPVDLDRSWVSGSGSERVYVDYAYTSDLFGDATTWTMGLHLSTLALTPAGSDAMPVVDAAPPSDSWPEGVWYIDYDSQPLRLVDVAFMGHDSEAQSAQSDHPLVFLRLWRDGETVDQWWPGAAYGDEGFNLLPDPATIQAWPRLVETTPTDPVSLTPWVEAVTQPDGKWSYLSAVVMAQAWLTPPTFGGTTDTGSESYAVSFPEFRLTYRSSPWRYVYADTPGLPPTRVFPRDDGLATSSARRVWPPPQSQQGSNRSGPGSYL
jgi:hypothetical protein